MLFGETRQDAARRKLAEELGLVSRSLRERGTYDVFLERMHAITTVFDTTVDTAAMVVLDAQSTEARWLTLEAWLKKRLPAFVRERLVEMKNRYERH